MVRPAQRPVRVAEDRHALVQHLDVGVAAPGPHHVADPAFAGKVLALPVLAPVLGPVVLVDRGRPHDPQVGARHERPVLVGQDVLRLDRDAAHDVQHPQQGLPGGLRPAVGVPQRPAKHRRTPPAQRRHGLELLEGARPEVERRVDEHHEVEQLEVARAGEESLGRGRQHDPVSDQAAHVPRVSAHQQARPPGARPAVGHCGEHREVDRQRREPPAVLAGGRQVGEHPCFGEHESPGLEVLTGPVDLTRRLVQTVCHPGPPPTAEPASSGSLLVVHGRPPWPGSSAAGMAHVPVGESDRAGHLCTETGQGRP